MTLPLLDPAFPLDTESVTRTTLYRVYWKGQDPLTPSIAGNNRYDCSPTAALAGQFGVLYLGFDLDTCWMETVVRSNMVRPAGTDIGIPKDKMMERWACEIVATESLQLARFADAPVIDLGDCASNIMADSYLRTRHWSQLIHAHKVPEVDGLYYRSRFHSGRFCIALFERAISRRGLNVPHAQSISPDTSMEIQSIMRRYRIVPT